MNLLQFLLLKNVEYMNYLVPIITSISIISCIINYIINPGIIYSDSNNNEKLYCGSCKFLYPYTNKKMIHCFFCNICVCNYDHHCGVIGKCVGEYNIIIFMILNLCGFAFFIVLIIIIFNLITR